MVAENSHHLLTLADVAAELAISHEQARQLCVRRKLRHINVGVGSRTEYRVERAWLDAFKLDRDSHARQEQESARRTARKYASAPMDFVRAAANASARGR
jgi:hypothetical protein